MKKLLFTAFIIASATVAFAQTSNQAIRFVELPYSEGVLYVSVTAGDSTLVRKAIEIDDTEVTIPVDFSTLMGSQISIQAFQDLNENRNLDKDTYGRPTEPCLQTLLKPTDSTNVYELRLMTF